MSTEKPAEWMLKAANEVVEYFRIGTNHPEQLAVIIAKHAPVSLKHEALEEIANDCEECAVEADKVHSVGERRAWLSVAVKIRAVLARAEKGKAMSGATILDQYPTTPELDKLKAVQPRSQACGEFLEWLETEHAVQLGKPHVHGPECPGWDAEREKYNPSGNDRCGFYSQQFESLMISREKLLAAFFGIDLKKVEEERRAILEHLRRKQ